ncbi:MAG: SDR family NAD(P)-dependent oxidoreductase [Microcoleaceae cyanobacterium]
MINLAEKVILVTGGSQGIGAATVKTLHQAGADVILHYGKSQEQAARILNELVQESCCLIQADLGEITGPNQLWSQALEWRGRIDVIVNNAGLVSTVSPEAAWETWHQSWQVTLQVNLIAVADLCRAAIDHFQRRGGGIIINISSRAAFRGDQPDMMHYAASKGGVISLTRSIARGFGKDRILAYAIAPGFVRTERIESMLSPGREAVIAQESPMGELAAPEDVANTVTFLASGLAPHATGTTIDINGASYVR